MVIANTLMLEDRGHAAHLLSEKLMPYKNSDAIVVGVGPGGASVGSSLAKELNLSFELILCRKIRHPGDPKKTIGSVSDGQVLMHNTSHDIPQDFLTHQIAMLQHEMASDYRFIYCDRSRPSFLYKTVILVGDLLDTPDTIMAALRSIKSQKPLRLIVAIPVVASHAASAITGDVDDLVFLHMESGDMAGKNFYEKFPRVDLPAVKRLWIQAFGRPN